jgi:hypothetical protein
LTEENALLREENNKLSLLVLSAIENIKEGNKKMAKTLPNQGERFKKPRWLEDEE